MSEADKKRFERLIVDAEFYASCNDSEPLAELRELFAQRDALLEDMRKINGAIQNSKLSSYEMFHCIGEISQDAIARCESTESHQ